MTQQVQQILYFLTIMATAISAVGAIIIDRYFYYQTKDGTGGSSIVLDYNDFNLDNPTHHLYYLTVWYI